MTDVEYIFAMEDGDTRVKPDVESAREFARENRDEIRGRVERRVWTQKGAEWDTQIDESRTKLISVDDLLNKDMRRI